MGGSGSVEVSRLRFKFSLSPNSAAVIRQLGFHIQNCHGTTNRNQLPLRRHFPGRPTHRSHRCPKIGRFRWEMTPNGEQFSTLISDFFRCISPSIHDLELVTVLTPSPTEIITVSYMNLHESTNSTQASHIFLQIFHSHPFLGPELTGCTSILYDVFGV